MATLKHPTQQLEATITRLFKCRAKLISNLPSVSIDPPSESYAPDDLRQCISHIESISDELLAKLKAAKQTQQELLQQNKANCSVVTSLFQGMLSATLALNNFSMQLYKQSDSLPLYKAFRKAYQSFSGCSLRIQKFIGSDQKFNQAKQKYLQQQTRLLSSVGDGEPTSELQLESIVEENKNLRIMLQKYEEELQERQKMGLSATSCQDAEVLQENLRLRDQIQQMEQLMVVNNQEFAYQIQKYNRVLADQKQKINKLEIDRRRLADLQFVLQELHAQLQQHKDQRFKDELMIENMTRKIRMFQRQRGNFVPYQRSQQRYLIQSPSSKSTITRTKGLI